MFVLVHDFTVFVFVQVALSTKPFAAQNEHYLYLEESHGFVTRGDTKIEATRAAIEEILCNAAKFVNKVSLTASGVKVVSENLHGNAMEISPVSDVEK